MVDEKHAAAVTKNSVTNDRIAFQRRLTNLETFVKNEINPVEEQILLLREQLLPLYDRMTELKNEAKDFCTHPIDMLQYKHSEDADIVTLECKFCNTTFHVKQ